MSALLLKADMAGKESLQTELQTNPRGTARHMSPHISVVGDMTSVDPTLL